MQLTRLIPWTIAACAMGALTVPHTAEAREYEVFIAIEVEEDLYDLQSEGEIGDDTFQTLLKLYQTGVDINHATRELLYTLPNLTYADVDSILGYRKEVGAVLDLADLVVNGAISKKKFLAIAPFLLLRHTKRSKYATDGFIRAQTRWTTEDARTPPMGFRARVNTLKHLTIGAVGTVTRNRIANVVYDPNRNALSATPESSQLHVPKLYARWDTDDLDAVVGSYRIGFGQRLVFDNTSDYSPNGISLDDELFRDNNLTKRCKETQGELAVSPCTGSAGQVYVTPDFRWRSGLQGVAVGLRNLKIGTGHAQAYAFASTQPKSIYQYELYDTSICSDPSQDGLDACKAPNVYRTQSDSAAPTSRFSFQTLPNLYRESVAGGNVTYYANERTHVGVTGYGAQVDWLTKGLALDFQEWSRTPYGGPYGAVGFDMAWGTGIYDVFAEFAQSFDSMEGRGGGPAGVVRGTATWNKNEVEATFRYYDTDFANPFGRPIAASDEFEGLRARDEVGLRLRYTGTIKKKLNIRASADLWAQPSKDTQSTLIYARADFDVSKKFRWGAWLQYQDKDLKRGGRTQCFEISTKDDENGEPIPCGGKKYKEALRLRFAPKKNLWIAAQLQHSALDDRVYDTKLRNDISVWGIVTSKPAEGVRIRLRTRYLLEDVSDRARLEESFWTYLDFTYRLSKQHQIRLRYDLYVWLDGRASTLQRTPSPEHWLWFEVVSKF